MPGGCLPTLVFILIMARGFYWDIFGRGEGFFTANRVSAAIVLLVVYAVGNTMGINRAYRRMREGQ